MVRRRVWSARHYRWALILFFFLPTASIAIAAEGGYVRVDANGGITYSTMPRPSNPFPLSDIFVPRSRPIPAATVRALRGLVGVTVRAIPVVAAADAVVSIVCYASDLCSSDQDATPVPMETGWLPAAGVAFYGPPGLIPTSGLLAHANQSFEAFIVSYSFQLTSVGCHEVSIGFYSCDARYEDGNLITDFRIASYHQSSDTICPINTVQSGDQCIPQLAPVYVPTSQGAQQVDTTTSQPVGAPVPYVDVGISPDVSVQPTPDGGTKVQQSPAPSTTPAAPGEGVGPVEITIAPDGTVTQVQIDVPVPASEAPSTSSPTLELPTDYAREPTLERVATATEEIADQLRDDGTQPEAPVPFDDFDYQEIDPSGLINLIPTLSGGQCPGFADFRIMAGPVALPISVDANVVCDAIDTYWRPTIRIALVIGLVLFSTYSSARGRPTA